MPVAYVLDWDGTIMPLFPGKKTTLEQLLTDYAQETQEFHKKLNLLLRAALIKIYRKVSEAFIAVFNDPAWTGESSLLKICDRVYIKPVKIQVNFMRKKAKDYAKHIPTNTKYAIKKCKSDLYIVTSEPKQLVEEILKCLEISSCFKEVYGPEFKIGDDIIEGFDELNLLAGVAGKYAGIYKICDKYNVIRALGDSRTDIFGFGLSKKLREKVEVYTFDTPQGRRLSELNPWVKIIGSIEEFLALDT
jgi:phosphoglycolate phosphatase-like HAD superfamily hydrolase